MFPMSQPEAPARASLPRWRFGLGDRSDLESPEFCTPLHQVGVLAVVMVAQDAGRAVAGVPEEQLGGQVTLGHGGPDAAALALDLLLQLVEQGPADALPLLVGAHREVEQVDQHHLPRALTPG